MFRGENENTPQQKRNPCLPPSVKTILTYLCKKVAGLATVYLQGSDKNVVWCFVCTLEICKETLWYVLGSSSAFDAMYLGRIRQF